MSCKLEWNQPLLPLWIRVSLFCSVNTKYCNMSHWFWSGFTYVKLAPCSFFYRPWANFNKWAFCLAHMKTGILLYISGYELKWCETRWWNFVSGFLHTKFFLFFRFWSLCGDIQSCKSFHNHRTRAARFK